MTRCPLFIAALVLSIVPTTVKAACIGDCHDDLAVTVEELITMVNIALETAPVMTCRAGDVDGNQTITVDEIVLAVGNALEACVAASPDLEKAAGVVHSTLVGLATLLTGIPVVEPDSAVLSGAAIRGRAARRAMRFVPAALGGSGATVEPCDNGGTANVSCRVSGGNSTLSATFSNCRMPENTGIGTLNGSLVSVVTTPSVCSTGEIPYNVLISSTFTNFTETIADGGTFVASLSLPSFTQILDAQRPGCAGANGTLTLNGTFAVVIPDANVDLFGMVHTLTTPANSSGEPCVATVTATGSVDLTDRGNSRSFTASFAQTHATLQEGANDSFLASLDGSMTADCVGSITVTTETLVALPSASCAVDGSVVVGLQDGAHGRIAFTAAGGLAFDYDGDGRPDGVVAECHDSTIAQCQ